MIYHHPNLGGHKTLILSALRFQGIGGATGCLFERAIMLFNRILSTRCHKTPFRVFISWIRASNIEAGNLGI